MASPFGDFRAEAAGTVVLDWVTLRCRFADKADYTPNDPSRDPMGSTQPGMDHYWREVSYGAIGIDGSRVTDWKTLAHPQDRYLPWNEPAFMRLRDDCIALHNQGAQDIDFSLYEGIQIVHNGSAGFGSDKGWRYELNLDGVERFYGVTAVRNEVNPATRAHEMGHGLGLFHTGGLGHPDNPYPGDYISEWDVMSAKGHCEALAQAPPCLPVHPLAAQKDFLGWIPASGKVTVAPNTQATVRLERLAQPTPDSDLMVKIPIAGGLSTQFYTVESRRKIGYDDPDGPWLPNGIPAEGVIIAKVDTGAYPKVRVVDGDNDGDVNDAGAVWLPGETFVDKANGVSVRVVRDFGTGYEVVVGNQPVITINNVGVYEPAPGSSFPEPQPDDGTTIARFTVRLSRPSTRTITVNYATRDSTATAASGDYFATQGTLTFLAGMTSRTIDVIVLADRVGDPIETYFVDLSGPVNAIIGDGQGTGRILPR